MPKMLDVADVDPVPVEPDPTPAPQEPNEPVEPTPEPQEPQPEPEPTPEPTPVEPQPDALAEKDKEMATLREKNARMEGMLDALERQPKEPARQPYEFLQSGDFQQEIASVFEDDPTKAMNMALAKIVDESERLRREDLQRMEVQVRGVDPTYRKAQEAYDELSDQAWFRNLSEDQQPGAAVAYIAMKEEAAAKPNGAQPKPQPTVSSPRRVVKPVEEKPLEVKYPNIFRQMGGLRDRKVSFKMGGR